MPRLPTILLMVILSFSLQGLTYGPDEAKKILATLEIEFTEEEFLNQASKGNAKEVELFVAAGMDPNVKGFGESTALYIAAGNNNLPIVYYLLDVGADPNIGLPALIRAIENKNELMVDVLLVYGAKVNGPRSEGLTPLMHAVKTGKKEFVKTLLEKGAEVNAKSTDWKIRPDMEEIITYGKTALIMAVEEGFSEIVEELINAGADVNLPDDTGFTPLHVAVRHHYNDDSKEIVKILIENGADVNATWEQRGHTFTPLKFAKIGKKNLEIILMLKKAGARE